MSYLPAPYPVRGRGGQRGGNQRGFSRGPKGNPRANGYNPRGGYGQGNPNYTGNNHIQQQPQIPQGDFYDPNGIWRPNQQLNPYNNNNYNPQPPIPNSKWSNPNLQDDSQEDAPIPIDWMDPKVRIDPNVMIQEIADIQAALNDLQADFNKERSKYLHMKDVKNELLGENHVLKNKNEELNRKIAGLREISNSLSKNVAEFRKMMKEKDTKNKLLKVQLDRARGREVRVEENGEEQAYSAAVLEEDAGFRIRGVTAGKVESTEKVEGSAMKNSSEAMKALAKAGEKKEVEAKKEGEAAVTETEVGEDKIDWGDDPIDYTLTGTIPEDETDYGYDDLNEAEEAVVPEPKPVEVKTKKRKASGDEEASVVEKNPKRARNRR